MVFQWGLTIRILKYYRISTYFGSSDAKSAKVVKMQYITSKKGKKTPDCIHVFSRGKEKRILSTAKLIKKGTTKIFHRGCLTPKDHYDVMLWLIQTLGLAVFLCLVS